MVTSSMLWFSRIARYEYDSCHIFHSRRCIVSSRTGFYTGNIHYREVQSDNTLRVPKRAPETRVSCEIWNVFIFEHWRIDEVLKGILNDTHQVFCGFSTWKRESCEVWNMFMFGYWRIREALTTHTKACIYIPKTVFKLPSGTHFLLPWSIPWIPYKTHPKEKEKIPGQYACYPNKKRTTAMMTSSFHFK